MALGSFNYNAPHQPMFPMCSTTAPKWDTPTWHTKARNCMNCIGAGWRQGIREVQGKWKLAYGNHWRRTSGQAGARAVRSG